MGISLILRDMSLPVTSEDFAIKKCKKLNINDNWNFSRNSNQDCLLRGKARQFLPESGCAEAVAAAVIWA